MDIKHLFSLSPAGTVTQGGAEAFKLPGGWIQIGRENLLERQARAAGTGRPAGRAGPARWGKNH